MFRANTIYVWRYPCKRLSCGLFYESIRFKSCIVLFCSCVFSVLQSQTAALPRHQEEEETNKTKQAQIEQTYEKH